MNIIEIAGHLGADPETKFTQSGLKVTTLRVATKSRKGGQDTTLWWQVSIWGDRFDKMVSFLKKGSAVIVIGEMQPPNVYNGRDGQPAVGLQMTADIVRFSPFGKNDAAQGNSQGFSGQQSFSKPQDPTSSQNFAPNPIEPVASQQSAPVGSGIQEDISDDDLPF